MLIFFLASEDLHGSASGASADSQVWWLCTIYCSLGFDLPGLLLPWGHWIKIETMFCRDLSLLLLGSTQSYLPPLLFPGLGNSLIPRQHKGNHRGLWQQAHIYRFPEDPSSSFTLLWGLARINRNLRGLCAHCRLWTHFPRPASVSLRSALIQHLLMAKVSISKLQASRMLQHVQESLKLWHLLYSQPPFQCSILLIRDFSHFLLSIAANVQLYIGGDVSSIFYAREPFTAFVLLKDNSPYLE